MIINAHVRKRTLTVENDEMAQHQHNGKKDAYPAHRLPQRQV